jgi:hypothetical protein
MVAQLRIGRQVQDLDRPVPADHLRAQGFIQRHLAGVQPELADEANTGIADQRDHADRRLEGERRQTCERIQIFTRIWICV